MAVLLLVIIVTVTGLLAWNGYQMWRLEWRAAAEQTERIVKGLALDFQYRNFTTANMAYLYTMDDAQERMAFAAGITQNRGKIGMYFDDPKDSTQTTASSGKKTPVIDMKREAARNIYRPELVATIQQYRQAFDDSLQKKNIRLQYKLHQEKAQKDNDHHTYTSFSSPFVINVLDPVVYHIDYTISTGTVFRRMLSYFVICLFVLLMMGSICFFYLRSYKMQLQMVQFREALFSNITHELKTPLSSLQLIMESAAGKDGNDEVTISREHLGFADSELKRMQLLVDKILSFGKMTPEQFELNKIYVNLDEVIREAINSLQLPASTPGVTCTIFHDIAIPGDRVLLINMLTTILDNAFKYSGNSSPVSISLERSDDDDAIIRIKDQGPGIAPAYHQKIFEPFFRIPSGNTHDVKGHGLGLSFAMQVARLHQGIITVDSKPGEGATFIIAIALKDT